MTEENSTPAKIKFEINLLDQDNIQYSDIQFVSFIRTPIVKQASFCIIQINLPVFTVNQLQLNISSNNHELWDLLIYEVTENAPEDVSIDLIFEKTYMILHLQLLEQIYYSKPSVLVKLVLVNPVLYALDTSTTFNQILNNVTAFDAIEKFEDFIDKTYGEFYYNHVGVTEKLNTFRYEQIFIPPSVHTIDVPKYIINTYKPFHAYSIYFFDDFYFSEDVDKDITCHFLNLADIKNTFSQFDVQVYLDFVRLTRLIDIKDFTDPFRILDRVGSLIYTFSSAGIDFVKKTVGSVIQTAQQLLETKEIEDKKIKVTKKSQLQNQKIDQSTRATTIYIPDNKKNAETRINLARELMFKRFENICFYETQLGLPYWIQFGCLYNMNDQNDYLYTPISIVNIFRRSEQKSNIVYCDHTCRYAMLKLTTFED